MRTGWLSGCAVAAALLVAPALSGQTLPLPAIPPERPPQASPTVPGQETPLTAAGAGEQARPRPWEYSLGVGAGYDSNIDFRLPDGPSSWSVSPRGDVARVFWSPRGELRLGGLGEWIGYLEENDLNRYTADIGLDGIYRSSPNTTWRASGSYELGYSNSSQILSDQGVLLPVVKTRTAAGGFGVTRTLGQRTSFRLDGSIDSVEFDEEDAATFGLIDGHSERGTTALDHRLGLRDAMTVEYSLQNTFASRQGGVHYLTHFGSLQWSHLLSPRSGFLLEAGASHTPDAAEAGLGEQESFFGGVSYNRQVKRSRVVLFARREVIPAFGLGVSRIENRFGLDAFIPVGHAWTIRIVGTHMEPETPEGAAFNYGTPDQASVILARRLGGSFEISGEGRYRRRGANSTSPRIEEYQVGLFLSLVSPSGGSASRGVGRARTPGLGGRPGEGP